MSASGSDKCINCNLSAKKFTGSVKRIVSEDEAIKYQAHCTKTVTIGCIFCCKCRLIVYRKQQLCKNENNSDANGIAMDPDFHVRDSTRISETFVELPFKRVVSTHKYCILCQSTSQLIVIPLEARLQAFKQKRFTYRLAIVVALRIYLRNDSLPTNFRCYVSILLAAQ